MYLYNILFKMLKGGHMQRFLAKADKELERSVEYFRGYAVMMTKKHKDRIAYLELPWYKKLWRKINRD